MAPVVQGQSSATWQGTQNRYSIFAVVCGRRVSCFCRKANTDCCWRRSRSKLEAEIPAELRDRIRNTRRPDQAAGTAWEQGTDLEYLKRVLAYLGRRVRLPRTRA